MHTYQMPYMHKCMMCGLPSSGTQRKLCSDLTVVGDFAVVISLRPLQKVGTKELIHNQVVRMHTVTVLGSLLCLHPIHGFAFDVRLLRAFTLNLLVIFKVCIAPLCLAF